MNNQQKTILFWLGSVFGVVLIIFFAVSIKQKLNTATTTNTVTFSGEGKVLAKPDVAKLNFTILTQAATSKAAQDANSKKSNEVTAFLKTQGIEDKDVKTSGYNVSPQYVYSIRSDIQEAPRISGYQVTQNFHITIRDLDNTNKVLDGVVAAGVNQVDQLQFEIENPEALKADARGKAIADAKAKSKTLESQIGIRLGKIVNFQEDVGGYPSYDIKMMALEARGGGNAMPPSIPSGVNEITVSVTVTYQIK
ncbi:MAG: SIMPL domain-containing protein [Patescibacteria group bacterium]